MWSSYKHHRIKLRHRKSQANAHAAFGRAGSPELARRGVHAVSAYAARWILSRDAVLVHKSFTF
jgi:hypothetical protein